MKLPPTRDDAVWTRIRDHDVTELWDHSIAPHVAAAYQARLEHLRSQVKRVTPAGGRILDVGAAQGTLGLMLAEEGFRVTLLDVRPQCMEYARARHERGEVQFVTGRVSPSCPPQSDYDTVVCTEVLEHAAAPGRLLQALRDKLVRSGALVLTTPNADYWLARLPSFGSASQPTIDSAEHDSMDGDAHRYLFTRSELIALVRGAGMRIEMHGFFLPFWLEGHLKTRHLHRVAYRIRGRSARLRVVIPALLGRRLCSAQWMVARRGPSPDEGGVGGPPPGL